MGTRSCAHPAPARTHITPSKGTRCSPAPLITKKCSKSPQIFQIRVCRRGCSGLKEDKENQMQISLQFILMTNTYHNRFVGNTPVTFALSILPTSPGSAGAACGSQPCPAVPQQLLHPPSCAPAAGTQGIRELSWKRPWRCPSPAQCHQHGHQSSVSPGATAPRSLSTSRDGFPELFQCSSPFCGETLLNIQSELALEQLQVLPCCWRSSGSASAHLLSEGARWLGKAPNLLTDHLCLSKIIRKDKSAIYNYKNQPAFE